MSNHKTEGIEIQMIGYAVLQFMFLNRLLISSPISLYIFPLLGLDLFSYVLPYLCWMIGLFIIHFVSSTFFLFLSSVCFSSLFQKRWSNFPLIQFPIFFFSKFFPLRCLIWVDHHLVLSCYPNFLHFFVRG